jgi:RimJ/RimL family protein N-acetyltransferase
MSPPLTDSSNDSPATRLIPATSAHFDWAMAGDESAPFADALRLPPGGLGSPEVLAWAKRSAAIVEEAIHAPGGWMIVEGDEVIGMIGFKGPPCRGVVEIGYGVVEGRRSRGHATRAVARVIIEAAACGLDLRAETSVGNLASQLVLERNGFRRCGERVDAEDGVLVMWQRDHVR